MALISFFSKLNFFSGKSTEGMQEDDLDFQKWISAHRNWRRRLLDYIEGSSQEKLEETVICRDNNCDLGKWIYGHGQKFYGDETSFQRLVHDHAAFHRSAGDVVHQYKNNGEKEARRTLNGDFDLHSMHVVSALEALERRVKH